MTPEQEEQIRFRLATKKMAFEQALRLAREDKQETYEFRATMAKAGIGINEYIQTVELLLAEIKRLRNEHQ